MFEPCSTAGSIPLNHATRSPSGRCWRMMSVSSGLKTARPAIKAPDDVVAALASFPPGLRFSHELTSVRIVPMSDDAAWAQLTTTTEIRQGERAVSEFTGVVLMLAQRDNGEWRIIAAHTSTTRPQMRSSG